MLDVRDQENDIWVWDLARETLTRLTFDPGADLFPIWTRDSRRILYSSGQGGAFNVYAQAADGTGTPARLIESPHGQYAMSMTADDAAVVVTDLKAAQNPDASLVPMSGKEPASPLLSSQATERGPDISPDGRFISYESDESSRMEIYVRPFPNVNDGKWMISNDGGTKAVWSPAGGELFYIGSNGQLMAVPVQVSPTFKAGTPVPLFEARNISTLVSGRFYDVTRDGRRFVMIKEPPPPAGAPLTPAGPTFIVVLNWVGELRAALGQR